MKVRQFPSIAWRYLSCLICIGLILFFISSWAYSPWTRRVNSPIGISGWLFRSSNGVRLNASTSRRKLYANPSIATFSSAFVLTRKQYLRETYKTVKSKSTDTKVKMKNIAYYDPNNEQPSLISMDFSECPYNSCRMTADVVGADAVLIIAVKLNRAEPPKFKRNPDQIWVFMNNEAPSRFTWFESLDRPGIRETINWTLTHKLDSDIPQPYGRLVERQTIPTKDYDAIYEYKTKMAAWFVSHCPVRSRRMQYVKRMRSRIDVDVFGRCGDHFCGTSEKKPGISAQRRKADNTTCFPLLSSTYKFYLAFENSLCQEYITEKFFKLFNDVDIVPVVRGGADYKRYFPEGMLIDAADFKNPEDLADYLYDLAQDKERYVQYLRVKNRYQLITDMPDWPCRLCQKLHTDKGIKTYENIRVWYTRNSCHDALDSYYQF